MPTFADPQHASKYLSNNRPNQTLVQLAANISFASGGVQERIGHLNTLFADNSDLTCVDRLSGASLTAPLAAQPLLLSL